MKFRDIKVFHTPDFREHPKTYNYVKDDVLEKLKVMYDGEDCFLNHMTTDEKPNPNIDKIMFRNMNQEIRSLRRRNYGFRKYIRLLHRIINFRDREISELKRNQIVVNIKPIIKTRKYGHVSTTTRLMRQIKSRTEKDKKE